MMETTQQSQAVPDVAIISQEQSSVNKMTDGLQHEPTTLPRGASHGFFNFASNNAPTAKSGPPR
jgi:hypothetical protein